MVIAICPDCNSEVVYDLTCHTWPRTRLDENGVAHERWMVCMPCDSAIEYSCSSDDCGWEYIDGLNPRNPKSEANEAKRPTWLKDHQLITSNRDVVAIPGVRPGWEPG